MSKTLLNPKFQVLDSNGDPLSGGKVNTYEAGTTTPKETYTEETLTTPQANPVILNSSGEPASPIWFDGDLKIVVTDSGDVGVYTLDNIPPNFNSFADFSGAISATTIESSGTIIAGGLITASAGIVETGGVLKENVLANTESSVCSNSTTENLGSQISVTGIALGVCSTSDTQDLAVGDLFEFDSGATTGVYSITAVTVDTTFTLHDTSITAASAHTGYEITAGFVAADTKSFDGWLKDTTIDIQRRVSSDVGLLMSPYYCREILAPSGTGLVDKVRIESPDIESFLGKPFTFGCEVITGAIGRASAFITTDGAGGTTTTDTNATTSSEWLEATVTVPSNATYIDVGMKTASASASSIFYGSMIAVRGVVIGSGNWSRPSMEIIDLENIFALNSFDSDTFSDVATITGIFMEAESSGKIGKGADGYGLTYKIQDSAPAYDNSLQIYGKDQSDTDDHALQTILNTEATAAEWYPESGYVPSDSDGNIGYRLNASGANTMTVAIRVITVKLN